VFEISHSRSQKAGDIAIRTGATTGLIRQCKRGDVVVQVGPEHAAAGAFIVLEAKEDSSYSLKDALADLEIARKNRGAEVRLFYCKKAVESKAQVNWLVQRYGVSQAPPSQDVGAPGGWIAQPPRGCS
jgi:hypothetical protein